jgi:hypothetical protein
MRYNILLVAVVVAVMLIMPPHQTQQILVVKVVDNLIILQLVGLVVVMVVDKHLHQELMELLEPVVEAVVGVLHQDSQTLDLPVATVVPES